MDASEVTDVDIGIETPLPVIMEEAGCRVTDLNGGPLLSGPGSAVMSAGPLHDELLALIRPVATCAR